MVGGNKGFENKKLNNFWVKLVRENSPTSRNPGFDTAYLG
jgi:hypothetical protein